MSLERHLPARLRRLLITQLERRRLRRVSRIPCHPEALLRFDESAFREAFHSPEIVDRWQEARGQVASFEIPDGTMGVNPGDRRAIFHLLAQLRPGSVLEVGTHIGASTLHIALALKDFVEAPRLVTVDIADVNDPIARPWLRYGTRHPPRETVAEVGCESFVEFIHSNSLDYLSGCQQRFDFIFLDGDIAPRRCTERYLRRSRCSTRAASSCCTISSPA